MARNDDTRKNDTSKIGQRKPNESKQDEADRYRVAAEDALQQLDWTIGYLHGIRKHEISKALAKNRQFIRQRLMQQPDPGMPTQETTET